MLTKADLTAETLAYMLEQSADCIKLIGLEGEILWMNPNGLCLMETDDFGDFENRQWSEFWPEESRAAIRSGLISAAMGNVARFDSYCATAKNTMKRWSVSISRLIDANKEHVGYLAVSRDISNLKACPHCAAPGNEQIVAAG